MNNNNINSNVPRLLYRGLPVIVMSFVVCVVLAKMYLHYATPQYESTAKIKLADIHEGVSDSKLFKDLDVFASSNKVGAEVELLKSQVLLKKIILNLPLEVSIYRKGDLRKTELYTQSPIIIKSAISNTSRYNVPYSLKVYQDSLLELETEKGEEIKTAFNHPIVINGISLVISKNNTLLANKPGIELNDDYEFVIHSENHLINGLAKDLDIMAVDKDVPVLRISYKCPVAQKAADIVNTLSAAYIADYIEQKYKSADTTESFLNLQLKTYSKTLSESENAVENYRTQNNIINIPQETETDLRKIADLKKQLANVKMNLDAIDSLNSYISDGGEHFLALAPNFEEFTDLLSTELVKKIKDLERDKKDLLLKYTPENEKVKVIDDKLKDITDYLQESIRNSQNSLRVKYHDLQKTIAESNKAFVGLPSREKNMHILDRNFGLNDQIYRFLHEKRTEAEIAKAATISFHRIISEGEVAEKPVSPNVVIITVLAAMLGLLAGVAIVFGTHAIRKRVNDQDTIGRLSDTFISASIPFFKKEITKSRFFNGWAMQMELRGELKKGSVITISSYNKLEGKTKISNAFKHEMHLLDKNTMFINADEIITGELEKPCNWNKYLNILKGQYDLILIKNFALNEHPAGMLMMATADVNLFLLDGWRTKRSCIQDADVLKEELHLPNLQFVLNRAGYIPSSFIQIKELVRFVFKPRNR